MKRGVPLHEWGSLVVTLEVPAGDATPTSSRKNPTVTSEFSLVLQTCRESQCSCLFRDHDEFEAELSDLTKKFTLLDMAHQNLLKERDELNAQVDQICTLTTSVMVAVIGCYSTVTMHSPKLRLAQRASVLEDFWSQINFCFPSQVVSDKQAISLLKQDKDYFSKQVSELGRKFLYAEEKIVSLNDQLDRAKQSREDLYDKYVASR